MMRNLRITREEAIQLIADDDEVDKMPMSKVNLDIEPAKVKDESEYVLTDNQKLVVEILNKEYREYTAAEISADSDGALSSRGLGSVMRKLIELEMVVKIEGRPVRYKSGGQ